MGLISDAAYHAAAWQPLYTTLASASATLTGLLFVGLSLNLRTIIHIPEHSARSNEALGGMVSLLVLSLLILIPQDSPLLGGELIVGGLLLALHGLRLQALTLKKMKSGKMRWAMRFALLYIGPISGVLSGISLIIENFGGLFWLVPTILIYLVWSINNARLLVVEAFEEIV